MPSLVFNIVLFYVLPLVFLIAGVVIGIKLDARRKNSILRLFSAFEILTFLYFLSFILLLWTTSSAWAANFLGILGGTGAGAIESHVVALVFLLLLNISNWWPRTPVLTRCSALISSAALIGWLVFWYLTVAFMYWGVAHGAPVPIATVAIASTLWYLLTILYGLKSAILFTRE